MKGFLWFLLAAAICAGVLSPPAWTAEPDGYWQGWRERQRAELAILPKPPSAPAGEGSAIDPFLAARWAKLSVEPSAVISDRVFARRVYLDVVGLLPTVDQLNLFERDPSFDKRAELVDALLADKQSYAEHWMTFWNDLLRNDEQTKIDGLRKPI